MSGDQLNLDAIEATLRDDRLPLCADIEDLVAEVRRLRDSGTFAMGVQAVLMSLDRCADEYEGARVLASYREMVMPEPTSPESNG